MQNRFFEKVKKEENCWIWTAAQRGNGYGCMKVNGKVVDAHRISWLIHKGPIPKDLMVCHSCDNRICVNPSHLFLGTAYDNVMDCLNKGRMKLPEGGNLYKPGNIPVLCSLNEESVLKIKKALLNRGNKSIKNLAIEMGFKPTLLADINSGRTYKRFELPV